MSAPYAPAPGRLRGILDHALDAQSANDEQQRLLSNPLTPEVDSLEEHLRALLREGACPRRVRAMYVLIVKLEASNRIEREQERAIATEADELTRAARAAESGQVACRLPRHELARALREQLDPMLAVERGEAVDADRLDEARRELAALFASSTRTQLLGGGMAKLLGPTKTELLGRLVAQRP